MTREHPVSQRQHIHARLEIAGESIGRRRHDGLVLVEAGVENEWHAGQACELGNQRVEALTVCSRPVSSTWVTAGIFDRSDSRTL